MAEQAGHIFKQQIRRVPGFSQPGKLKEQGPSWVVKSSAMASKAESLAGESSAQQVKFGHGVWVGFSCIAAVPLSFAVKQCAVTLVGLFIHLTVSHADKISGTGQPLAEAADAGEHINESNGFVLSSPTKKPAAMGGQGGSSVILRSSGYLQEWILLQRERIHRAARIR